jgi:urease accessory protein UreF
VFAALVQAYSGCIQRKIYKQAKHAYQQSKVKTTQEELKLATAQALRGASGGSPVHGTASTFGYGGINNTSAAAVVAGSLSVSPKSCVELIRSLTTQESAEGSGWAGASSGSLSPGSSSSMEDGSAPVPLQ